MVAALMILKTFFHKHRDWPLQRESLEVMEHPWSQRESGAQHHNPSSGQGCTWNPYPEWDGILCRFLSSQSLPCSPSSRANNWPRGLDLLRKQEEVEEVWTVSRPVISSPLAWPTGLSSDGQDSQATVCMQGQGRGRCRTTAEANPRLHEQDQNNLSSYGVQISVAPEGPKAESVFLL